jgi:hypothetical protein
VVIEGVLFKLLLPVRAQSLILDVNTLLTGISEHDRKGHWLAPPLLLPSVCFRIDLRNGIIELVFVIILHF